MSTRRTRKSSALELTRRDVIKGLGLMSLAPLAGSLLPSIAFGQAMTRESIAAATGPINMLGSQPYETPRFLAQGSRGQLGLQHH